MIDPTRLQAWLQLPDTTRLNIFTETARRLGLSATAVEKDWWVVHTLALVFSMECAPALIFKGGTSLSKGWGLIQRFSEDIDLAIDREYLGFPGELDRQTIKRLRKKSYKFMTETFLQELTAKFNEAGFTDVRVDYQHTGQSDQDPVIVGIYYRKLTEANTYQKRDIELEVGCRSLREPTTNRPLTTLVAEQFNDRPFADAPITIPVVNPERTFLEKIFLLHEEFQKPTDKIRVNRLSRHLYDIEKLSQSAFADLALNDTDLYQTIVDHRSRFTSIAGIDYGNHNPGNLAFVPPVHLLRDWEADYRQMRENMIYGEPLGFTELIQKLSALQTRINSINWNEIELVEKTSFQQTEVGEIPSDWEVKKLNEVAKLSSGTTPSRALNERYFSGGRYFWVKTMDLNNSAIYGTGEKITDTALKEVSSLKVFSIDTVLVAMYGGFNQIGRTGILRVNACINQALTAIQVDGKKVNSLFLLNYLNYRVEYWKDVASSSRKDPNITGKDVKEFPVPLPPTLTEQTAIATALTDADALITQLSTLIAKKKAIKQGAMQELLTPKDGWEEKKLGEVAEVATGNTPPTKDRTNYGEEFFFVGPGDLGKGKYILDSEKKLSYKGFNTSRKFPKDSILFTCIGSTIGKSGISDRELTSNQQINAIFPNETYSSDLLYYSLLLLSDSIKSMAGEQAVPLINKTQFCETIVTLPSTKAEQKRIAQILSDMDAEVEKLEQRLAKQKMLKQGMMQVLLTGKIRLV